MIPKIIHYCWFGKNELSELAIKCIDSWKRNCPGYQIIEWNENNFDINFCDYSREAYENKKWAFVSDVSRLYALVNYGGIYMDTDVELLKPLDSILDYQAVLGFESTDRISTGLIASEKNQQILSEMLNDYKKIHFVDIDGNFDLTTNVVRFTKKCKQYGLLLNNTKQTIYGLTVLPIDYLCPKNPDTKELNITSNTICIHYFDGSWVSDEVKYIKELKVKMSYKFPRKKAGYIATFIGITKYRGLRKAFKELCKWIKERVEMI